MCISPLVVYPSVISVGRLRAPVLAPKFFLPGLDCGPGAPEPKPCDQGVNSVYESASQGEWDYVDYNPSIHWQTIDLNVLQRVKTPTLGGTVAANYFARFFQSARPHVATIGGFTVLEQIIWSLVLASLFLLTLRMLSRFTFTNAALHAFAGAVAILAFPLAATLVPFGFGFIFSSSRIEAYHFALFLEVMFVLICGILYYLRKPPLSTALMIPILFSHFGVWAWLTSSYVDVPAFVRTFRGSAYYRSWAWTLGLLSLSMIFNLGFLPLDSWPA
jgi:hypothetical protein